MHLLHLQPNVTRSLANICCLARQSLFIAINQIEFIVIRTYHLPLIMLLIAISEAQTWTKYGGGAKCKIIVENHNDEIFTERAKGWTFGYIKALNEMMQQNFRDSQAEELIWQALKKFCADNPGATHDVASASIYIEVLRDQGAP